MDKSQLFPKPKVSPEVLIDRLVDDSESLLRDTDALQYLEGRGHGDLVKRLAAIYNTQKSVKQER